MKFNIFKTSTIIDRENASHYIHRQEVKVPYEITNIANLAFYRCEDL